VLEPIPGFDESIIVPESTIIIGLSGGPDSMYLLYQLHAIQKKYDLNLFAIHIDHEWQETSYQAAQLCNDVCALLNVRLIIKKISQLEYKPKWNGSLEELGRNIRRYVFESIAQEYTPASIALAHHRQDQQETFFIRLLRGSSLTGLTGMKSRDNLYIRPMLNCSKKDILNYLRSNNISFYVDQTNTSDLYLRNRIRNHILPALESIDQRFDKNIIASMHHLAGVDDFLDQQVRLFFRAAQSAQGVDLCQFLLLHIVLAQRILIRMMIQEDVSFIPSQKLLKEIMRFLAKSLKESHAIHGTWMIKKTTLHFNIIKNNKIKKTL